MLVDQNVLNKIVTAIERKNWKEAIRYIEEINIYYNVGCLGDIRNIWFFYFAGLAFYFSGKTATAISYLSAFLKQAKKKEELKHKNRVSEIQVSLPTEKDIVFIKSKLEIAKKEIIVNLSDTDKFKDKPNALIKEIEKAENYFFSEDPPWYKSCAFIGCSSVILIIFVLVSFNRCSKNAARRRQTKEARIVAETEKKIK